MYNECIHSGLPLNPPDGIIVTPLSNTSFTIAWARSDPTYNYTVIWSNLNTGVMESFTVPENMNGYTVTGLRGTYNYNVSVAAVGTCGNKTSDPIPINGYGKYAIHVYVQNIITDMIN